MVANLFLIRAISASKIVRIGFLAKRNRGHRRCSASLKFSLCNRFLIVFVIVIFSYFQKGTHYNRKHIGMYQLTGGGHRVKSRNSYALILRWDLSLYKLLVLQKDKLINSFLIIIIKLYSNMSDSIKQSSSRQPGEIPKRDRHDDVHNSQS